MGDGRRLHMVVMGEDKGQPTVILEQGMGSFSSNWYWVQSDLAAITRVVAYDRAGLGWSDPLPGGQPHNALGNARALHTALVNAGISGPYVLVGHSAGGINMLVFAATFPEDTAGFVLLDSTHPDQFLRYPPKQAQAQKRVAQLVTLFAIGARLGILRLMNGPHFLDADELTPDQRAALQAYFASTRLAAGMKGEVAAQEKFTFPQARAVKGLGDVPLVVLTAGETAAQVPVQIELHDELASLSSSSIHHVVEGASHTSLASHSEFQPQVTAAIRQVMNAVQTGMPLEE
jgi:pimeloyl-ACP methyl ester carboxylesterase